MSDIVEDIEVEPGKATEPNERRGQSGLPAGELVPAYPIYPIRYSIGRFAGMPARRG